MEPVVHGAHTGKQIYATKGLLTVSFTVYILEKVAAEYKLNFM